MTFPRRITLLTPITLAAGLLVTVVAASAADTRWTSTGLQQPGTPPAMRARPFHQAADPRLGVFLGPVVLAILLFTLGSVLMASRRSLAARVAALPISAGGTVPAW